MLCLADRFLAHISEARIHHARVNMRTISLFPNFRKFLFRRNHVRRVLLESVYITNIHENTNRVTPATPTKPTSSRSNRTPTTPTARQTVFIPPPQVPQTNRPKITDWQPHAHPVFYSKSPQKDSPQNGECYGDSSPHPPP